MASKPNNYFAVLSARNPSASRSDTIAVHVPGAEAASRSEVFGNLLQQLAASVGASQPSDLVVTFFYLEPDELP